MKIKSIVTEDYNGTVYNFECSPSHTYVANGIVVHNCDVPKVEWAGNVPFEDLKKQLYNAIGLFPETRYTERLNLHFARMGEPIFNDAVFEFAEWLYRNKSTIKKETGLSIEVIHPVLTTSLPRAYKPLKDKILRWCDIKNNLYNGQAGLQFSINSTNESQRDKMFSGMSLTLEELATIAELMPQPLSRKYCLNFAFSSDFEIDADKIKNLFDSEKFMCKITPIHNNNACRQHGIETVDGYESFVPYSRAENDLKSAGFDVLVFVPSIDEEKSIVTCGNVILGGSKLTVKDTAIKIHGVSV